MASPNTPGSWAAADRRHYEACEMVVMMEKALIIAKRRAEYARVDLNEAILGVKAYVAQEQQRFATEELPPPPPTGTPRPRPQPDGWYDTNDV